MTRRQEFTDIVLGGDTLRPEENLPSRLNDDRVAVSEAFTVLMPVMGRPTAYRPEYCEGIVAWFQDGLYEIMHPERIENKIGDVKHVTRPIFPRTISGYACTIGVGQKALWDWANKYDDFRNAMNVAKGIQEQCVTMMTATGAWTASFGIFMLKNCAGWTDKVDVTLEVQVPLTFDHDDSEV